MQFEVPDAGTLTSHQSQCVHPIARTFSRLTLRLIPAEVRTRSKQLACGESVSSPFALGDPDPSHPMLSGRDWVLVSAFAVEYRVTVLAAVRALQAGGVPSANVAAACRPMSGRCTHKLTCLGDGNLPNFCLCVSQLPQHVPHALGDLCP